MILRIWFCGDLEESLSNIKFPENFRELENIEIEIETPCLPNVGDELDWITFANVETLSSDIYEVLEDLSLNSMVARRFWSRNSEDNITCSLYVDIIKQIK